MNILSDGREKFLWSVCAEYGEPVMLAESCTLGELLQHIFSTYGAENVKKLEIEEPLSKGGECVSIKVFVEELDLEVWEFYTPHEIIL